MTRHHRTRSYEVRCLPRRFPKWRFQRLRAKAAKAGLIALGSRAAKGIPPWVAIFDSSGTPRWWYPSGTRPINVQVLRGGTVAWSRAFGDGYGRDPRQAQEIHALSGKLLQVLRPSRGRISDPHELTQEKDRDFLVESYVPHGPVDLSAYGGPKRAAIVYPEIQELSRKGRLLRRWSLLHKITLADTASNWWPVILGNPRRRRGGLPTYDVVHVNAIDPWGHELVVSTRHTNAIFGFSRKTGKIRWKLGGTPAPESLTMSGAPTPLTSCSAASTTSGSTGTTPSASSTTAPCAPGPPAGWSTGWTEGPEGEVRRRAGRSAGPKRQLLRLGAGDPRRMAGRVRRHHPGLSLQHAPPGRLEVVVGQLLPGRSGAQGPGDEPPARPRPRADGAALADAGPVRGAGVAGAQGSRFEQPRPSSR